MTPDPERFPGVFIHPLAVVDDTCTIGAGTRIWSGALVRAGSIIGADVSIAVHCAIEGAHIGDGTHLNPGVLAGPGAIIGARCFLAGYVVLCNDAWPSVSRNNEYGVWEPYDGWVCVRVGDDTSIGTNSVIMPGVTIGKRCMIAAMSCVTEDVPDDCLYTRDGRIKRIRLGTIQRMKTARPVSPHE